MYPYLDGCESEMLVLHYLQVGLYELQVAAEQKSYLIRVQIRYISERNSA